MKKLAFTLLVTICGVIKAQAFTNELTLYVYPPSKPLNWSTPKSIFKSFIGIYLKGAVSDKTISPALNDYSESHDQRIKYYSTMGHSIAHIKCSLPSGEKYQDWVSFTGQNYSEENDLNTGLGVLFKNYSDGYIITGEQNIKKLIYIKYIRDKKSPRYLKTEVTSEACQKLKNYVEFFKSFRYPQNASYEVLQARPENKKLFFSSILDPYETYLARQKDPNAMVGGGCAPFVASLLKVAGRYQPEFEQSWKLNLTVSEKLIGGESSILPNKKINLITQIFLGPLGKSWTHPGFTNRSLKMYDPNLIWNFIGQTQNCLSNHACQPQVNSWLARNPMVQIGINEKFNEKLRIIYRDENGVEPDQEKTIFTEQKIEGLDWAL